MKTIMMSKSKLIISELVKLKSLKSCNTPKIIQLKDVAAYQESFDGKGGENIFNISMEIKETLDGKQFS